MWLLQPPWERGALARGVSEGGSLQGIPGPKSQDKQEGS